MPLAFWDLGIESHRGRANFSPKSVVCCQVEVSVSGCSLVQRNPTKCDVSECDREKMTMERWPTSRLSAMVTNLNILLNNLIAQKISKFHTYLVIITDYNVEKR